MGTPRRGRGCGGPQRGGNSMRYSLQPTAPNPASGPPAFLVRAFLPRAREMSSLSSMSSHSRPIRSATTASVPCRLRPTTSVSPRWRDPSSRRRWRFSRPQKAVSTRWCWWGIRVKEIVEFAMNLDVDLIVAGTRGRSPAQELYLGSVSSALAHRAPCSVLIVR